MRNTMKMSLAALASLALIPTAVTAYEVKAPYYGKVVGSTWSGGTLNGGVNISSGSCNYWGVGTGVVGSVYWNVTIYTPDSVCSGDGTSTRNEARHTLADGWAFRLLHFNKTTNSYDRTCDRCQVGDEGATGLSTSTMGARTRLQHDKSGTLDTSWYEGYVVVGQSVGPTTTIGYLN